MRSRFWAFVEACDEAQSIRAVKDLLAAALRPHGVESYAIMTHVPPRDLGSLAVLVHSWPEEAIAHLFLDGAINPIFEKIEGTDDPLHWSSSDWGTTLRKDQRIQTLQRPQLRESDRLTQREHECLYRAAIRGERPSAVARELGVKVSTVRTLRQKAYGRLGADSPEQALWRMMETGQLFQGGRKTKRQS